MSLCVSLWSYCCAPFKIVLVVWRLNVGPCMCWASPLPLRYTPVLCTFSSQHSAASFQTNPVYVHLWHHCPQPYSIALCGQINFWWKFDLFLVFAFLFVLPTKQGMTLYYLWIFVPVNLWDKTFRVALLGQSVNTFEILISSKLPGG